ncbi:MULTISPECIES: DUF4944 domain-containing protein [Bacillus]|uniref:DUF4944 domain-containing protein n=1 Tax=Bacillus TaxID=1386 RepID=UPI00224479D0|nr:MULTISPECIES: DUF4944 domain-containing protein [Bacillus]MDN5389523.1 DUF4944 domain-containing protein [Bacillus sp. LB7]MEC1020641.1 DUF4944 domain-containing protein [Bacillus paralicheniformis]MEC1028457.1 DUF4944 domain-containing protein [Bacillus paralicheniformis]MEC1034526.1 DUF4944 domain-containing protein [Bacillus paralicheniformis]MEC1053026.1 DUF4944 domain-containing protein [Bacillus paralicheniformis]
MKQEYKRPLLFIASLFTAFCAVYFGGRLIGFYMTEYPKWNGQSADENWEAVIKKIEGRAYLAETSTGQATARSWTIYIWKSWS